MQVYIEVIAMDHENGVKKTVKETVEVPKAVLAVHRMFAEGADAGKLVTAIAQSVYMGARKELDAGRKNQRTAMNAMVERGGKIGGNQPRQAPVQAAPGAPEPPAPMDPLAESLGLDVIQKMARKEGRAPAPVPVQQPAPQAPSGPVAGFPAGHPGHRPPR